MLFMGEEWSERAPFLYFTSHTDKELGRAVRRGRMEEYDSFVRGEGETESTLGGFADPQSEITFVRSKLNWNLSEKSPHAETLAFYRDALSVRRAHAPLSNCDKTRTRVDFDEARRLLTIERGDESGARAALLCNLDGEAQTVKPPEGAWRLALWTGDVKYGGDPSRPAPPAVINADAQTEVGLAAWGAAVYVTAEQPE
jgi:maltooligosyltrehalose trehalohydrolase